MFKVQNWKVKLVYAGFGCLFGSLCTIMGMLASPVTAQRDKFGEIECTRLVVVDPETGKTGAVLFVDEDGGTVAAFGKEGESAAALRVNEHGGRVSAIGKDGQSGALFRVTEHGGRVHLQGKGEGKAVMSINEYGNGAVSTWDKNGYRQ